MIIDTHCHLDFPEFDSDRESVIKRAAASGVKYIINVASSFPGCKHSIKLAEEFDAIYASVGIHPHHASEKETETALTGIKSLAKHKKVVAVGEVGLDYYRNKSEKSDQRKRFIDFINIASENDLPLIVHSRDAGDETLDILKKNSPPNIKAVMHCFSGDDVYLKKCLDMGLFISFTCNLTFKNARHLRETARLMPLERLFLETDAPFLAPQACRGKRNEPSYLTHIIKEWSEILSIPEADVARVTTENAINFFKLSK